VDAINARRAQKQWTAKADYLKLDDMGILGVTLHDDARREEPGDRGRHLQLTREEREGGQAAAGRAQPL